MVEFTRKPGTDRFTILTPVPCAYPSVVAPKAYKGKNGEAGKPRYSANLMFKPDNPELQKIKALWVRIIDEKWPGRRAKEAAERQAAIAAGLPVPSNHLVLPYSVGDVTADEAKANGKDREFYRGHIVIPVHSDEAHPPKLSGFENGAMTAYNDDTKKLMASKFYHGVEVVAQINFVAYVGGGKPPQKMPDGVTAYCNMIHTYNKGAKLPGSGGANPAEVFKGCAGNASQEDPTAGQFDSGGAVAGDGIPF